MKKLILLISLFVVGCTDTDETPSKSKENKDVDSVAKTITKADAKITKIKGEVFVIRNGKSYQITKVGLTFNNGDTVITRRNGYCDIELFKLGVSQLRPNSRMVIGSIRSTGNSSINITKGKSLFILQKLSKKQKFKVSTPTIVAAVRGTSFLVDSKGESTKVAVLTGKVEVNNDKKTVMVNAKESTIGNKYNVKKPKTIDRATLKDIKPLLNIKGVETQRDYEEMEENISVVVSILDELMAIDEDIDVKYDLKASKIETQIKDTKVIKVKKQLDYDLMDKNFEMDQSELMLDQ
jgi:hypothetical protein